MPLVRFNIITNFRGVEYRPGDEAELTEAEIKTFDGTGSSGMPHIIRVKDGATNAQSGDVTASDHDSE